jgi:outer membrane protein TolC
MNRTLRSAAFAIFALSGSLSAQSLTVTEAARLTASRHPSRAAAQANRLRAEAGAREATAARLPLVNTEANLTRFQEPMVVAPLHGFDPRNPPTFDRTLMQANLSASYVLYDGGARGARIDRAETLVTAASAGDASVEDALLADGVRAYLSVVTR